jgi:CPA2 family monovalent cation:H+ antiporter-2
MNGTLAGHVPVMLMELGVLIVTLGIIARLASRLGISPIPFYLLVGLGLSDGGILPLHLNEGFIEVGAEIGVILLLFTLGLEYTAERLGNNLRSTLPAGIADFVLNFTPGFLAGLLLGWNLVASLLLAGVVYISSSGIIAKLLTDLSRMENGETPTILSILVLEDIAMMVFLPLMSILLVGQGLWSGMTSMVIAGAVGGLMFFVAMRYGKPLSRLMAHQSNEIVLLTTLGLTILIAGLAEWLHLSAAVGAFIVGITMCKPIARQVHQIIGPLRDLFAAIFFLFFGLGIDPASLPPVMLPAIGLGIVTACTKMYTAWWTTRHLGLDAASRLRAGLTLIARGEFSLVIAAMGVSAGLDSQLGTLATAYVLFTAILSPLLLRVMEPVLARIPEQVAVMQAPQPLAEERSVRVPTTVSKPHSVLPLRHS